MSFTLAKPKIKFSGSLLYSINQKKDGKPFTIQFEKNLDSSPKTALISFMNRNSAILIANMIETKQKISNKAILQELYIQKWDSYALREYTSNNYINLVILDSSNSTNDPYDFEARLYECSEDLSQYVEYLDSIYEKSRS
jgi:hypothetical protein